MTGRELAPELDDPFAHTGDTVAGCVGVSVSASLGHPSLEGGERSE